MMKSEFENLAGREVTNEQYRAIETLYMSSNLEKAEFVKSIRTMLKSIPQPERKKDIKRMVVRDRSGYRKTPNGYVYDMFVARFAWLARVISFEAFSMMVDEALERMKKMIENNKAMQTLVSGEAGETVEKDM